MSGSQARGPKGTFSMCIERGYVCRAMQRMQAEPEAGGVGAGGVGGSDLGDSVRFSDHSWPTPQARMQRKHIPLFTDTFVVSWCCVGYL